MIALPPSPIVCVRCVHKPCRTRSGRLAKRQHSKRFTRPLKRVSGARAWLYSGALVEKLANMLRG